ncbi:MAG: hypothetical protein ABJA49_10405 [Betaproteobacteria bacterium]
MRQIALASVLAVFTPFTHAQVPAVLGKCIVENMSPSDRQDIARWVFASMAVHPEVKQLSAQNAQATQDAARKMGTIFTRLLRDICPNEFREAAGAGGPPVVSSAINFFTQIGIQELMTNKVVLATHASFGQYADKEGIDRIARAR